MMNSKVEKSLEREPHNHLSSGQIAEDEFVEAMDLIEEMDLLSLQEPTEIVFDDVPVETILYGDRSSNPTSADLFHKERDIMKLIRDSLLSGNVSKARRFPISLGEEDFPLSSAACRALAISLQRFLPTVPGEKGFHDLSLMKNLVDKMWDSVRLRTDKNLLVKTGLAVSRWYEHNQLHEKARKTILELVRVYHRAGNIPDKAGMINNYGYQYMLEGDCQRAMFYFQRAANLFQSFGCPERFANARVNYWLCRSEHAPRETLYTMEGELEELSVLLEGNDHWQQRKMGILRARIEGRRDNQDGTA